MGRKCAQGASSPAPRRNSERPRAIDNPPSPRVAPGGTLLFLHGGGWTLFDSATHSPLMRALAAKTGWAVAGLEHPRAPEAPYPEPVEACANVTRIVTRLASISVYPGQSAWPETPREQISPWRRRC
jgi:acetyl esterase